MPNITIEMRRTVAPQEEEQIMEAVHSALREAFKIPEWDRVVRLIVHEPRRFQVSPRLANPELLTLVTIDAFLGRSVDAKRALYAGIVRNLSALGIPANHVLILVREAQRENWGVAGGKAASDIDLGFNVNV
jgi:phenylpyruvate tautomerase PptA (4-oxalocrotonate tautomerase family)